MERELSNSIIDKAPDRVCPICGRYLSNAEMGVNAHLRMHIRKNQLSAEKEQGLRNEILQRRFPQQNLKK